MATPDFGLKQALIFAFSVLIMAIFAFFLPQFFLWLAPAWFAVFQGLNALDRNFFQTQQGNLFEGPRALHNRAQ